MKSIFPRQAFAQSLRRCLERFPAAAGFIAALTALLLVQSWGDKCVPDRLFSTGLYYLSVGGLLSLVLRLWSEETENRRTVLAAKMAGHIALLIDAAYLYDLPAGAIGMEAILMHASLVTALALSVCILPFLREKDDIASWNFAWELTGHLISSCLVGLLMFGGLSLLTASLSGLFGLDVDSRWYLTWCTVCLLFLSLLLFLGRIPAGEGKHDRMAYTPPFVQKTIRYLFLPLMGCYLLVLYAYLAKILAQWELPDGWVARLVTALMGGCIATECCLYPLLRQGGPRFERLVARWLPVAILPLLALMTVGIARRIGDYGYTPSRLYLLTLNLWFYLVCGGLFLSRKRIRWIPVSFAAIFLLTSVLPWNLTSVSRRYLLRSVDEVFRTSCKKPLPLSDEDYLDWLRTLPRQEALNTNDRLRYLAEEMDEPAVARYISPDIYFWGIRNAISEPEKYTSKPMAVPVKKKPVKATHYGRNIEGIIDLIATRPDGETKTAMIRSLAIYMRQQYLIWNKDSVADETIFQDIEKLSDYRIKVPEGLQLTKIASNAVFSKPSLNPVKSSNNQRQKNGGMRQRMRK